MTEHQELTGIGVSPGIAIGPALVIHWSLPDVPERTITRESVDEEIARLRGAIETVRQTLDEFRRRTAERVGADEAGIFDAQILMLQDSEFMSDVERLIRANQLSAEQAFEFKALELRALWGQSSSPWLRDRRADLFGIQVRVLHELLGLPMVEGFDRTGGRPAIVFVRELTPGLTVQFSRDAVAGFVSEEGTRTAHAAILAHSLGIPCVMGLVGSLERVRPGSEVVLDGTLGTVLVEPSDEEVKEARRLHRRRNALERELERSLSRPPVTTDGVRVTLLGNVDLPEELEPAIQHGAEGVGLMRTEFLVAGRSELPTEDEQVRYFAKVANRFRGHPVIIRSYDLGGDKFPAPFRPPAEANPFLGWRAIRVCLDQPEMFKTQIRAILRVRAQEDVRLMLPLVTSIEELDRSRELVAETAEDLQREGIAAAPSVPVGVMVETPAAALMADQLAQRSDFLSVGSNDLTQYTLAVDRGNARLADRFTAFHPAVVRSLKDIAMAGARHGMAVSVCGEMASEPIATFLLLGLGYTVFSVSPPALPLIRWVVRQIDYAAAVRAADAALSATTTAEMTAGLRAAIADMVDVRWLEAGRLPKPRRSATFKT